MSEKEAKLLAGVKRAAKQRLIPDTQLTLVLKELPLAWRLSEALCTMPLHGTRFKEAIEELQHDRSGVCNRLPATSCLPSCPTLWLCVLSKRAVQRASCVAC